MVWSDMVQWAIQKWHSSGLLGKFILVPLFLVIFILLVLQAIVFFDDSRSVIEKWGLIGRVSALLGDKMESVSYFDAKLIIAVIVVVVLVATSMVGIITWAVAKTERENEKRRYLEHIVAGAVQENDQLRKEIQGEGNHENGVNPSE